MLHMSRYELAYISYTSLSPCCEDKQVDIHWAVSLHIGTERIIHWWICYYTVHLIGCHYWTASQYL